MSSIELDRSSRSVVAICGACGAREVTTTETAADRWTLDHANVCAVLTEADHRRVIQASQKRATRRA